MVGVPGQQPYQAYGQPAYGAPSQGYGMPVYGQPGAQGNNNNMY